jgi:putative nucleotidyltransferase with HDIG domain
MEDAVQKCSFCGEAIGDQAYVRMGKDYCCEGCYLKQHQFKALKELRDELFFTLPEALVAALDEREHKTGLHSKRVACYTLLLAKRFTEDQETLRQIYWGALLHDIGKIGIPDSILLKQGALTQSEWVEMRTHTEKGYAILSRVPFLTEAAQIVLSHEERFNGTGYPRGLAGNEIPWGARLFAVIDTLDAITSDRPYRKESTFDKAKEEILRMSGTQFDPLAVEAFVVEEKTLRVMLHLKCSALPFDLVELQQ